MRVCHTVLQILTLFQTKSRHFLLAYSDLASKIHTSFQTLSRKNDACHNYLDEFRTATNKNSHDYFYFLLIWIETLNTFIHTRSSLANNDSKPKWTKSVPASRLLCFRGTEWTLDIIILLKVLSRLKWTWMESEKINSKQWTGFRFSRKDHAELSEDF